MQYLEHRGVARGVWSRHDIESVEEEVAGLGRGMRTADEGIISLAIEPSFGIGNVTTNPPSPANLPDRVYLPAKQPVQPVGPFPYSFL